MILRIYTDDRCDQGIDVPVTPQSTVFDVIECCRDPDSGRCHLVETWRNHERIVGADERLFEILMHWGVHRDEVRFNLRYNYGDNLQPVDNDMYTSSLDRALQSRQNMTYEELQNRAGQQQRMILQQQQRILAKEQRLRFLQKQEILHNRELSKEQQTSEQLAQYEKKLRQLNGSRDGTGAQTSINPSIADELDSFKHVFSATENELSSVIAKAEFLSKQLQDYQNTRCEPSISEECQRLRSELILRKKLTEEQTAKLEHQSQTLTKRKEDVMEVDAKIAELQDRIRHVSTQKQNGNNARRNLSTVAVAMVEPFMQDEGRQNSFSVVSSPSKLDPKYQSLPSRHRIQPTSQRDHAYEPEKRKENYDSLGRDQRQAWNQSTKNSGYHPLRQPSNGVPSITISPNALENIKPDLTSPTMTVRNGPVYEKVSVSSPEIPPTRYMPPFTASVVFPSNNQRGVMPVYTTAGGRDTRQMPGLPADNTSAFHRSPSGRYHFDDNLYNAPPNGIPAPVNNTINQPYNDVGKDRRSDYHRNLSQADASRTNFDASRQYDPRASNFPAAGVRQETAKVEYREQILLPNQNSSHHQAYGHLPPADPFRGNSSDYSVGNFNSPALDIYARPSQPRFASSSEITKTYFRRPGSAGPDTRRSEGGSAANVPERRTPEPFPVAGIPMSRAVASPTALIRPMQNVSFPQSVGRYGSNSVSSSDPRYPPVNSGYYGYPPGKQTPTPYTPNVNSNGNNAATFDVVDGRYIQRHSTAAPAAGSEYSRVPMSKPPHGYTYEAGVNSSPSVSTRQHLGNNWTPPVRKEVKRISFSDERFIPTSDALLQLDGHGSYYHSVRHPADSERSPGLMKMNAPKPLRRRLSGESSDGSLVRPVGFQQHNIFPVVSTIPVAPITNPVIPEETLLQTHGMEFRTMNEPRSLNRFPPSSVSPVKKPTTKVTSPPGSNSTLMGGAQFNASSDLAIANNPVRVPNSVMTSRTPDIPIYLPSSIYSNLPVVDDVTPAPAVTSSSVPSNVSTFVQIPTSEPSRPSHPPFVADSAVSLPPNVVVNPTLPPPSDFSRSSAIETVPQTVVLEDGDSEKHKTKEQHKVAQNNVEEGDQPLEGEPEPVPLFIPETTTSKRSNLKKVGADRRTTNRITFDPLVLLLDACLEGELDIVMRTAKQVEDPSMPNDEGITALHNAICAGHFAVVKFLVEFGCDVNSADTDGWTPLHCAASCNNLEMAQLLVENGACIFAVTTSDQETGAQKCERDEDGYDGCSKYLQEMEEKLGKFNSGAIYALYDYTAQAEDELSFQRGDKLTVLRKGDESEGLWWFARLQKKEGYVPRNYFGAYPLVTQKHRSAK